MEDSTYLYQKRKSVKKVIVGSLLILLGIVFLGFNMGWLQAEYKAVVFSWPMLLIAIGILNFSDKCSWITGLIFTGLGVVFLLPKIPGSGIESIETIFWPVILIAAGLFVLTKKYRRRHPRWYRHNHRWQQDSINLEKKTEDGYFYDHTIFAGSERSLPPGEFKGGKIETIFGGAELDFTKCTLAPGKNILELECIFGGVEIRVPSDWKITLEITPIMGGFVDKRKVFTEQNANAELIIRGNVVFGGGELKS